MAKAKKMTEEEIVNILAHEASQALGPFEGDLASDVERSFDYYMGKPYGDELDGRSKFVTREVLETIEGMMPYLVKIFFSSDMACVFEPDDEDDINSAEQETEYCNWVFYRSNPGFKIGYQWIKDGLMSKVGVVKAVREGQVGPKVEKYEELTEEQVAMLLADLDESLLESVDIEVDEESGLSTVKIRTESNDHKTKIYNIPPENFRISDSSADIETARYTGENYEKSISELREMGFDVPDDISDTVTSVDDDVVEIARHEDIEPDSEQRKAAWLQGASRVVTVFEEYVYLDADGDGFTELLKIIRVGDTILEKVEVEARPYHSWSPYMIPHRFHGMSAADLVMDIQRLKSRLWRNILDNQFLQINGRYAVVDGQVNLDDLMTSSAHGIVRQNFAGAVEELPTPRFGPEVFSVLELVDHQVEKRSGVSERGQGLDPKQFNSNTAMGTAERVMDAADQKVELVARIFAETGLKSLMLGIHRLGLQFESPGKKIRNNNGQFVTINPREWKERNDMTITVGIGNGSKTHQMFAMNQIMTTQQAIVAGGGLGTIVTPTDVFNLAMEQTRVLGRKDGSKFFTRPESDEIPDPGPSIEEQTKLLKAQTEQFKAQTEAEISKQKLELEAAKQVLEEEKLELEKEKLAFEQKQHADENEFRLLEAKIELEQERATLLGKERESK